MVEYSLMVEKCSLEIRTKTPLRNNELNYDNFEALLAKLTNAWHIRWIPKTLPQNNGFSAVINEFNLFCEDPLRESNIATSLKSLLKPPKHKERWEDLVFIPIIENDLASLIIASTKRENKKGTIIINGIEYTSHRCYTLVSEIPGDDDGKRKVLNIFGEEYYATFGPNTLVLPLTNFHKENTPKSN